LWRCSVLEFLAHGQHAFNDVTGTPLIDYANLDESARVRLTAIVASQSSLQSVLDWGRQQMPRVDIESILTQDEYTHDVLIPFEGRYLVYDTT